MKRTVNGKRWGGAGVALLALVALGGCSLQPQPIPLADQVEMAAGDRQALFQDQEPITAPLTFYDVVARTLKYNLDQRLKIMETALAQSQRELTSYDLLPHLVASAGYADRNNRSASSSLSVLTNRESLEPSTSQDRARSTGDLNFSWNILDFGVSYFSAKQESDRFLIAEERRRKVIHNLMQEVRLAYWRAVSYQRLAPKLAPVLALAEEALENSRKVEAESLQDPMKTLEYQRRLVDMVRQLETMQNEFIQAKANLDALINVPPGTDYQLADALADKSEPPPALTPSLDRMEQVALLYRPELREERYLARISSLEVRKAILRLLPGLELNLNQNYDSNSFLVDQAWVEASGRITWNLVNLLSGRTSIEVAERQEDVARMRRLALSMAVLGQVHVAWQQYRASNKEYQRTVFLDSIEQRILTYMNNTRSSRMGGELEQISAQINALRARMQRDDLYAQLQHAVGQLDVSLGLNPLPDAVPSHELTDLAAAVAAYQRDQARRMEEIPVEAPAQ